MKTALRTVLVGAGKVGMAYADDPIMAKHYPYATHAQVLAAHSGFEWMAVVDPSEEVLRAAAEKWRVPLLAKSTDDLPATCRPDVAVLATPPGSRIAALQAFPSLRAVLVEKPLGQDAREAGAFLDYCRDHNILVQVNIWRRADENFRALAAGDLEKRIGAPQAVFGVYGNGLANNGTHMIDFARMLLGEIESVQAAGAALSGPAGPIPGDVNLPFSLRFRSGLSALFHPVRFSHYRENALEIWGERGRLSILQEGLGIHCYPRRDNRAMSGEFEIDSDAMERIDSTVGHAFYRMYGNLALALRDQEKLWAPGVLALQAASIIQSILRSSENGGRIVSTADDS